MSRLQLALLNIYVLLAMLTFWLALLANTLEAFQSKKKVGNEETT